VVLDGALEALVSFMDAHPRAGIAGSLLVWPDGEPQTSAFRFFDELSELDRGLQLGAISQILSPRQVIEPGQTRAAKADWVCGASLMIRRSTLEQIGLLDEGLYTYFDDIDICLRAHRAGWETWVVPTSRVVHLCGASTGVSTPKARKRWPPYVYQARRRFFLKNYGPMRTALADLAFLVGHALWRVRRRIQRKPDTDPPHLLFDSFRHSVFVAGFRLSAVENPALKEQVRPDEVRDGGSSNR
jgi:GT2 family glycosyltransferase